MIRVVLADDHRLVRQKLKRLLGGEAGWQVVGEAADGLQAVRLVRQLKPDVLVTDLTLPGLHGLEVTRRVHRHRAPTRIVVVSIHADEAYVRQALRHGARAYVHKDEVGRHLLPAIRAVLKGARYLSPALAALTVRPAKRKAGPDAAAPSEAFDRRARALLQLAAQGCTDREIAFHLRLTESGAARLRLRLFRRLGARTEEEFIALARKLRLAEAAS
jgi:DNA-binding NarL/FixJ family response regulator